MIFINGIEFEIKEKDFSTTLADISIAIQNPKEFLIKHTTLTKEKIDKITEAMPERELVEFIHKKLDIDNEETLISIINNLSKKLDTTEYIMLSILIGLGYKYTELIKLGSQQLVECFMIEVSNNADKINGEYIERKLLEKYSEESVKAIARLIGIDERESKNISEMNDLISSLNNL